jgi:protein involved in polysaccharide export with SLBB domain
LEETYFHQATVVLDVRESDQYRGRVFLLGEVRNKGSVPLPADEVVTLSDIILRSGGFTELADTSSVTLIRRVPAESGSGLTEESREQYDVGQMLETGNFEDDPALVEDDLVLVPKSEEVGGEVYVLEAVNRPGALPVPSEDFTMSQAILAAGGFTRFARGNRVRLVRYDDETGEKQTTYHDIQQVFEEGDRSDDPVVAPGDFIIVEERTFNFGG